MRQTPPAGYLSPKDAATKYGLAPMTVYRWIKAGHVAHTRIGRLYLYVSDADMARLMGVAPKET